eukprot:CAMPEP_0113486558 /NCGR_PEP_ID=MMETSP0014_2-20120614/25058_1 /TAXON_ID=2857 /ORGANISM="Nitzschia sp." /LENGTH=343 /DNA_ID=CAMNT_0000380233 /DNA_START=727 /DNA_END=1754 /DNA_ORIENTATION=- /assembly_acc=CAM_ASM_000159
MSTNSSLLVRRFQDANRLVGNRNVSLLRTAGQQQQRPIITVTSDRQVHCLHQQQQNSWTTTIANQMCGLTSRSYVSRAHPKPITEFPIAQALDMILDGVEERKEKRAARWEKRKAAGKNVTPATGEGEYRNLDETIEMAINLNVDPRKPGQAIRGSLVLPHGTGKKQVKCLVFTNDGDLAQKAAGGSSTVTPSGISTSSDGSITAGGDSLIEQILAGEIAVDDFERALCTKDVLPQLQKQLARLLGPRGLMPNVKTNTVFDNTSATAAAAGEDGGDLLLRTLREQSSTVTYRTDPNGILHFVVGKGSFEPQRLLENIQAVCQTVQDVKPESYGKGKKKSGGGG